MHSGGDLKYFVDNAFLLLRLLAAGDFRSFADVMTLFLNRCRFNPVWRPGIFSHEIHGEVPLNLKVSSAPLVSIIIPIHNNWSFTFSCLHSLDQAAFDLPYEIILVDDASTDETSNCNRFVTGVMVIRNQQNLGFIKTCNVGAIAANGKYLLFLNNDTNVQQGWLDALVGLMEQDASIGLAGPKLIYPDGRLQEAGGIIWNDASGWNYGKWDDPFAARYNYLRETDYVSGACILIRKTLWEEIGGFDERYLPAYYEDVDLAFEVRKRGFRVIYQPASVVVHFEGASCGSSVTEGVKSFQLVNQQKFFSKWEAVLKREHFLPGQIRSAVGKKYGSGGMVAQQKIDGDVS